MNEVYNRFVLVMMSAVSQMLESVIKEYEVYKLYNVNVHFKRCYCRGADSFRHTKIGLQSVAQQTIVISNFLTMSIEIFLKL